MMRRFWLGSSHLLKSVLETGSVSSNVYRCQQRSLSLAPQRLGLMEFFDNEKNWGEDEIKVGRPWKVDELRIKSNVDLHKLWYILLKERNMLFTMEHECKKECELFPNPERIDKVEESMKNIETVVRERNRAYFMLETGTTGERTGEEIENFLGLPEYVLHEEHHVAKELNKPYLEAKEKEPKIDDKERHWFRVKWMEKLRRQKRKELKRHQYEVINILQKFPDVDIDYLKEIYPDVDIDKYVERFCKDYYNENLHTAH